MTRGRGRPKKEKPFWSDRSPARGNGSRTLTPLGRKIQGGSKKSEEIERQLAKAGKRGPYVPHNEAVRAALTGRDAHGRSTQIATVRAAADTKCQQGQRNQRDFLNAHPDSVEQVRSRRQTVSSAAQSLKRRHGESVPSVRTMRRWLSDAK